MKKFLICLSLLFSFCFIGNIKAFSLRGVELEPTLFSNAWNTIESNSNYDRMDYPYAFCYSDNSSRFLCYFFKSTNTTYRYNQQYIGYGYRVDNTITNETYLPGFIYNVSSDSFTYSQWNKTNSYFYPGYPMYTSVDYYYNTSTLIKSKSFDYIPVPATNTVNFYLNGGTVMDFSNILDPNYIELDYQIETTTEELEDYLQVITPMKSNYTFMGWYYDSEFTQPYDSSNTLSSDIDLYAKWQYNPIITLHLNGGNIEDNFTNYKEINNIKEEMCELANCTQYNSWATNPYKELMTNIENGRNSVSYFLSNYDATMNSQEDQEFTNLASELLSLYQTNGTKYVDDYSIRINYNEIDDYLSYVRDNIDKLGMVFRGFYYDSNFIRPRVSNNNITEDIDLYVKWIYDNVDDFLSNTNFTTYTFNTNYDYAIITPHNHLDDVYLGINTLNRDITLNYYMTTYNTYTDESFSLEPLYSKNNIYYYLLNVYHINNTIEVLLLPKTVFENNNYDFLLTDNAYITYTNDLTEAVIYDNEGNEIETDISESYQTFQNNLINDETDLLMIFKNLINNKDNRVFSNVNTIWNQFKKTKLYPYFMILIVGSLIILIIKSARRN